MIETHIISDDPVGQQIKVIVGPPADLEDGETYVASIRVVDESGYETGLYLDAYDAYQLMKALADEVHNNGVEFAYEVTDA
jgi:hypothetical protein